MPAFRKQHYVPRFYQLGFADSAGFIWVYDRKEHDYKRLSPKVICRTQDLYTVKPSPGVADTRVETDILTPIDGAAAPVIAKLGSGYVPSDLELAHLIVFISVQFTRIPSFGKAADRFLEVLVEERITHHLEDPKRVASDVDTPIKPELVEELVNDLRRGRIRIKATEVNFLRQMFDQAQELGLWLHRSEWTLSEAPAGTGFIISDHPFTVVPIQAEQAPGWGLPGATILFPLTRRLCLKAKAGDYGFGFQYRPIDSRAVRIINHNLAANSDRFIMGPVKGQLEAVVKRSRSQDLDPSDRFSFEVDPVLGRRTFVVRPSRYFY